jgi:hypothetical protein
MEKKSSVDAVSSKNLEFFFKELKKAPEQTEPLPRQRLKSYVFGLRYSDKTVNKD